MDIKNDYPEYASIEEHIRKANAERSVYIAHLIADGVERMVRGLRQVFSDYRYGLQADWEKRFIEADSFLKRSVPRY